jgi:hypothetical protein
VIFSTRHRAILRLIIAERERFDLAQLYYERGPRRVTCCSSTISPP